MAYLNANIPVEYAQIRREYLYDLKKHHGEVEDCIIFGVTCITGSCFTISCYHGKRCNLLSISRLVRLFKADLRLPDAVPKRRLDELQLWNSFSYFPAVTSWDILRVTSR